MLGVIGLLAVASARLEARAATPASGDTITVHTATVLRPLDHDLVGFNFHEGGSPLTSVASLQPRMVRVDADLASVSSGADQPLRLQPLLDRLSAIRGIGAEPLVILAYMPAWLGAPNAAGRDPTRVRPADLDAWQRLVHDVVLSLATAPEPALRFEAWNEPDIPIFWQDTPAAWLEVVERSARAVAAVEAETGRHLAFGGPATAAPDPVYMLAFLSRFRDPSLPLDFVSWHYYGNNPFLGPDGGEFPITQPVQPVLGQRNPVASPSAYGPQVDMVRSWTHAALAGSGRSLPRLAIDEWNLSAGGFDRRHDTAAGAAFAAGVLSEMQSAGLDEAAFYMATDTQGVPGEWGAVRTDGTPKPVWWTFELWQQLGTSEVAVDAPQRATGRLWAVATADADGESVLVSSFDASGDAPAREIVIRFADRPADRATLSVRRIDAAHPDAPVVERRVVHGEDIRLSLPSPGVVLVQLLR